MKNKFRVLLLACVLALSMCVPAFAEVITDEYNGTTIDQFQEYTVSMYEQFMAFDEATLDEYIANYEGTDPVLKAAFENLKEMQPVIAGAQTGEVVVETIEEGDGVLKITLNLTNESGEYVQTMILNEELYIIDFSFTEAQGDHDLGSLMTNAALNTVLGMGITFTVLILISVLISLFRFLPGSGAKKIKEAKAVKATVKGTGQPVKDEELLAVITAAVAAAEDQELVAVISAAIAAETGTSTDSFVVRSIKKRRW